MGRIFEVRKHAMFARWNRMAKQFSRIGKDITIAVKKGGPDPGTNPALRRAMQNARAVNMPKDKVESAIKRASGRDAANFEEVIYEGYAPHGVAVLVECATDNPTRTVASVRNAFNKNGGNLATTGSVSFQFRRMGVFRLNPEGIDQDDLELYLIDHGLEEIGESTGEKGEPQLVARCLFEDFGTLQKALEERGINPISAEHEYICTTPTELRRGRGHRSAGADRQARAGRGRAEGVSHARLTTPPSPLPLAGEVARSAGEGVTRSAGVVCLSSIESFVAPEGAGAHRREPARKRPIRLIRLDRRLDVDRPAGKRAEDRAVLGHESHA